MSEPQVHSTDNYYAIRMWEADSFWRMDRLNYDPTTAKGRQRISKELAHIADIERQIRMTDEKANTKSKWPGFQAKLVVVSNVITYMEVEA